MLPPMKKKSITVRLTGLPPTVATPESAASFMPGVALRGLEPVRVAHLRVAELERIAGLEVGVALLERARSTRNSR